MVGFRFSLQFNDSYAFREYPRLTENQRMHQEMLPDMSGHSRPRLRRCPKCGDLLAKSEEPLIGVVIKKRRYDIATTYDGVIVVSRAFKNAYEDNELTGLVFRHLPDDLDFWEIQATKIVRFDSERGKPRFLKKCHECGHYKEILRPMGIVLEPGTKIGNREFVRTDIQFGSGDAKKPSILCGTEAGRVLEEAKLKGLDLSPISD